MKYSILVLGVFDLGRANATALVPQGNFGSTGRALESCPDFQYTGTNEDGEQEEVQTGKG